MKAVLIGMVLIALAGLSWAHISVEQEVAVSGCCKEKVGDIWRRTGDTYERCDALNKEHDNNDNIFEPAGKYWWDAGC